MNTSHLRAAHDAAVPEVSEDNMKLTRTLRGGVWVWLGSPPGRGLKQITTTPSEILQYLLEQAVKLNADNVESLVNQEFNAVRVSSATTTKQWAQLLASALRNLSLVYICRFGADLWERDF